MLAQVCVAVGDHERAPAFIDALAPYRGCTVADRTTWGGSLASHLGRLYLLMGRVDEAESAMRDGLADHEKIGSLPMTALAKLDLGALLVTRDRDGDRAAGEELLADARRICEQIGIDATKEWPGWPSIFTPVEPAPPPLQPAEVEPSGALIGRDAELARLVAAWRDAANGATRTVIVSGEPGAGKSRLIEEIASRARGDGAIVLRGHSDDGTGGPYQPFVEALAQLVSSSADDLPRMLGRLGSELSRLVPEVADRLVGRTAPTAL